MLLAISSSASFHHGGHGGQRKFFTDGEWFATRIRRGSGPGEPKPPEATALVLSGKPDLKV